MPLINTQYDSIMREYARRQARSRQELEERLARIHRELPALSSLEDEITACQAGKVRAAVSQDRKQTEALDAALQHFPKMRLVIEEINLRLQEAVALLLADIAGILAVWAGVDRRQV